MTSKRLVPSVFGKGYALVSPDEQIDRETLGDTADEAIALKFKRTATRAARWEAAQATGWTVRLVYVRVFIPVFKSTMSTSEMSEVYDEEDI